MKKNHLIRNCFAASLAAMLLAQPASAAITKILGNPADYTSQANAGVNNPIGSGTDAIGFAGGSKNWNAIIMFPLPTLPAGKVIGNQTSLTVVLTQVATSYNGDLWGVANFRTDLPTGTPNSTYYYYNATDAGPGANPTSSDAKLVNNFLVPGMSTGVPITTVAAATNTLQTYIQSFYSTNTNYDASVTQAYVWFRINPDADSLSTGNRFVIDSADTGVSSAVRPTLNLDIADPQTTVPLTWNGNVSSSWDTTTANWKSAGVGGFNYSDGSAVSFDDTLAGSPSVLLNTTVLPSSSSFNNSANKYVISGSGKISGTNSLTKLGTNTLVLDTANDYSGTTTLAGGTLQVGNSDTNGSFGTGNVIVSAASGTTLAFNRTDAITVGTIANGGGNPNVVINSGTVTLAGDSDNNSTGATINSGATLILGKPSSGGVHALGINSTINPGGVLQLGGTGGDQIFQNAIITNNGTFDLNGTNEGFNGLTGSGVVTDSVALTNVLELGDGNGSATFAGLIVNGLGQVQITKAGSGTQTLTGASTYTGITTVNAGELVASTASTGNGDYLVADSARLGVRVAAANGALNIGTLTLNQSFVEFQNVGSSTAAPINVSNLVINSTTIILVTNGNFVPGQSYPLIAYSSLSGGGALVLGELPPGVFGNLDTSASPIKLNVTSTSLTWNGNVSGDWDIGATPNWKVGSVTGLTYPDNEIVTFDDSLSGNPAINLTAAVSPNGLTISNNTTRYSISGNGYITGPVLLVKTGTNTLVLDTDNDYFGGTVLAGGTLQIGNNDTHGAIGSGTFTNLVAGSILAFNRTDAITVNNTITRTTVDNSAALVINSGSVTIAGNGDNSGAGATVNAGATLILAKDSTANIHALSSANLMVNSGGLLQLAGFGGDQIFTSSGMTDNGVFDLAGNNEGFDRLAGTGVVTNSGGGSVVLQLGETDGTSTFAGTLTDGSSASLGLTKIGAGTLTLAGANKYSGDTTVNAGKLVVNASNPGTGNYTTANSATLGVIAGANTSLNVNSLTLGSSTVSTYELQNINSTTAPAINAATLNLNSAVTVNIVSGSFVAGQNYPLIAYGSRSGTGSFVLGSLPPGMTATLSTGSSPISLQVTSVTSRTQPQIMTTFTHGNLTVQWPADHTGWLLQSNAVDITNPNDWFAVSGSTNTNSVSITPTGTTNHVFYRLRL